MMESTIFYHNYLSDIYNSIYCISSEYMINGSDFLESWKIKQLRPMPIQFKFSAWY